MCKGEQLIKLQSDHMFYTYRNTNNNRNDVVFLINKKFKERVTSIIGINEILIQLTLKINQRCKTGIIQNYAPATSHEGSRNHRNMARNRKIIERRQNLLHGHNGRFQCRDRKKGRS